MKLKILYNGCTQSNVKVKLVFALLLRLLGSKAEEFLFGKWKGKSFWKPFLKQLINNGSSRSLWPSVVHLGCLLWDRKTKEKHPARWMCAVRYQMGHLLQDSGLYICVCIFTIQGEEKEGNLFTFQSKLLELWELVLSPHFYRKYAELNHWLLLAGFSF